MKKLMNITAPPSVALVTHHVDARKSHVDRPDLERHDVIPERGKCQWHHAKKDHDRSVHRTEHVVKIGGHFALRSHVAKKALKQSTHHRDRLTGIGDLPAHRHHQQEPEQQEHQRRETVLDADDLVIRREHITPEKSDVVMVIVMIVVRGVLGRFCSGLHVKFCQ